MSHNSLKVNNIKQNNVSEISLSIDSLSDVSGVPAQGQYLTYSSGIWSPSAISGGSLGFIRFGQGESENYIYSPATAMTSSNTLYVYDTSPINTITGATLNTTATTGSGGGSWLNSLTLPAGTYRAYAGSNIVFSGTGYFQLQLFRSGSTGTNAYTSRSTIGLLQGSAPASGSIYAMGMFQLTSQQSMFLRIVQSYLVDTVANQGTVPSEYGHVFIEKLA